MRTQQKRWRRFGIAAAVTAVVAMVAVAPNAAAAPNTPVTSHNHSATAGNTTAHTPRSLTSLATIPLRSSADFTYLIAYSFGNRVAPGQDTTRTVGAPGPVNEALADTVAEVRGHRDIPVYAQTEIADVLAAKYHMRNVIAIGPEKNHDGTLIYLSTDGVAAKVAAMRAATESTDVAGVIAFQDHLWRATYTSIANGINAFAPAGIAMPSTYDPQSGQQWTRSALAYLPTDYLGRAALVPRLLR
ncbi:hypothetical protein GCM10027169_38480 [Gordonia jinhuaensis]|uniref:Uncharacterized protein n=1 Tax=Gordonia jinhuaensis TaxID=1517702 RepID=A0A916T008_9ACTN|nr:hypothetical protein [Gordonia jinhuaensis]GGB23830.1 hypothetical protein GCM10011489_10110 [Gordonia jinhuaensis]